MDGWLGVVIMIALGAGFAGVMIGLSLLLGPKNPTPEKLAPYECGMPAVGDARERHSVKFYLVAMIFLLFDIEIAFLYPWAVALRDLGWVGFDAANGICPTENYVRIAVGLDSLGATPIRGTSYGGGVGSLTVALHVRPVQQGRQQHQSRGWS